MAAELTKAGAYSIRSNKIFFPEVVFETREGILPACLSSRVMYQIPSGIGYWEKHPIQSALSVGTHDQVPRESGRVLQGGTDAKHSKPALYPSGQITEQGQQAPSATTGTDHGSSSHMKQNRRNHLTIE